MPTYSDPQRVPVDWIGSSKKDLRSFPSAVVHEIGIALLVAQYGGKAPQAKPLKSQGGGVVEIVENFDGRTFRAVYTVRFSDRVYVLHCFQKKSHKGRKTDKKDMDLIQARLKVAEADYRRRQSRK